MRANEDLFAGDTYLPVVSVRRFVMSEVEQAAPRFLTVGQAAKLLGVSPMTIYRAVDDGGFPAIRTRGRISVPAKAIDAMEEIAVTEMRVVDSSEISLPLTRQVNAGGSDDK